MTAIELYRTLTIDDVLGAPWAFWVSPFYDVLLADAVRRVVASPSSWFLVSKDLRGRIVRRWNADHAGGDRSLVRAFDDPAVDALWQCFVRLTWQLFIETCGVENAAPGLLNESLSPRSQLAVDLEKSKDLHLYL